MHVYIAAATARHDGCSTGLKGIVGFDRLLQP